MLASYPHDTNAFTEGLFVRDGKLFESTGYERASFIREVDLASGKVLRQVAIPPDQFGEGIVDWGGEIVSVTWQGGVGHRWRIGDLTRAGGFRYDGEGWGLTRNDRNIILSDGTPVLRFLDPVTLKVVRRLPVTADGQPLPMLNELEWVDGEILANVWHQDRIARIDPQTGRVKGWIDLSAIVAKTPKRDAESVPERHRLGRQGTPALRHRQILADAVPDRLAGRLTRGPARAHAHFQSIGACRCAA